ncbi:hypothetical protein [Clostridium estertheticum]|nr:hypothetical protein [Clostridium estertheticum]MBX4272210.1 hypothetical protein [Clostridium estertheticum]
MAALMVGLVKYSDTQTTEPTTPTTVHTVKLTPQQIESNKHDKWVEEQYNEGTTKLIVMTKNSMNDPSSFKAVNRTKSFIDKDLVITLTFRGKNSFGGIVEQSVKGRVSYKDNSVTIIK